MKSQDEIIQELVEQGNHDGKDAESMAYQIVFNALRKEPTFSLSARFADSVVQQFGQLKEVKATRRDFIWLGTGLFVFLVATIITIELTNFKFGYGAFSFLGDYRGLLLFGAILILCLQ